MITDPKMFEFSRQVHNFSNSNSLWLLISQTKTMPHESEEGSRVIIITNDILTIFPYHYLCRALPGKDEIYKWKLDESWPHANTERSKPNRFRRNRPSEQTNCHGPLCMVNSKLMLNYRKLMSSRRKKFLFSKWSVAFTLWYGGKRQVRLFEGEILISMTTLL